MKQIEEIKDSGDRVVPLIAVAQAYQRDGKRCARTRLCASIGLTIQLSRLIAWQTGKLFGVDAQDLLANIHEPELALVSRIEMAGALLSEPLSVFTISVVRAKAK